MEFSKREAADVNMTHSENSKENIIEIEIPYQLFLYLSTEEYNLQNICRICLSVNDQALYPLFSANEQCVLANMFIAISEVQICPDDGLPSNICQGCQTEVMNYYEFKMKCVKSDYALKSVLKGEYVNNEKCINDDVVESKYEPEINDSKIMDNNDATKPDQEKYTDADYLEGLKDSIGDDEALCIVQDIANNQKEITIIESDPKNLYEKTKDFTEENGINLKKGKHQCTFCPKKFHDVKSVRDHISRRHATAKTELPFPCRQCKDAFDAESDLDIHSMLHKQDVGWRCTQCEKQFTGRSALRRHIERHMTRRRFACARCGAAFVERYALRRHSRVHSGLPPDKKHQCTQCDKRFSWGGALRAHMAAHGAARGCVCAACGDAFSSPRLLASHQRVHSDDKPYQCTHCDKRFRHESTRNTHVRTHTGERPYTCACCGKSFIQHSNLTLHMRTHTGERPYSCMMCERKFSSSSTLKAHVRTHTGERPYSCKVCGKRFARVSLKNHMRLHSGERPYACPAPSCLKRFATQHRLKEHYRLHTGEKPYECADCLDKFTTRSQLIKHVKKHDKKKKAGKKGVMLKPVTVSDKNIRPIINPTESSDQFMFLEANGAVPSANQTNLCMVHDKPETLIYEDGTDIKTEVIVLEQNPNLITNSVSYVNDVNYTDDVNLVTVNEGEVSISAASATADGSTVKLYQYDQSLLQIHTGGGQLTISRISSKMTANF